jgi:predicted transcriptional regulator
MGRTLPNVTDAEWSVLEQLWAKGPATVRQLTDALYPNGGASEYATVHKLLERLDKKGFIRRRRSGGIIEYQAVVDREQLLSQQLDALVEKMCGGSLQPLLTNLIRGRRLSGEELRELAALVESLDSKSKPRKGRG